MGYSFHELLLVQVTGVSSKPAPEWGPLSREPQVLPATCSSRGFSQGHIHLQASTCSGTGSSRVCQWLSAPSGPQWTAGWLTAGESLPGTHYSHSSSLILVSVELLHVFSLKSQPVIMKIFSPFLNLLYQICHCFHHSWLAWPWWVTGQSWNWLILMLQTWEKLFLAAFTEATPTKPCHINPKGILIKWKKGGLWSADTEMKKKYSFQNGAVRLQFSDILFQLKDSYATMKLLSYLVI